MSLVFFDNYLWILKVYNIVTRPDEEGGNERGGKRETKGGKGGNPPGPGIFKRVRKFRTTQLF